MVGKRGGHREILGDTSQVQVRDGRELRPPREDAAMVRWRVNRFGVFIHWGIIINGLVRAYDSFADFDASCERRLPEPAKVLNLDWECCMTMPERTLGYQWMEVHGSSMRSTRPAGLDLTNKSREPGNGVFATFRGETLHLILFRWPDTDRVFPTGLNLKAAWGIRMKLQAS